MKRLALWLSLISNGVMAQNITRLEYFFDTDPGYGNATNIAISSSPDIALNFTANLSGLSTGIHQLYVRAKDANAKWGLLNSRSVVVQNNVQGGPLHNIVRLEYFFDLDPGVGNAISIPITSGTDVTKNFTIPFTGIADGFHSIYMRAQDATGIWSLLSTRFVFVQPSTLFGSPANVSRIEYFIDTDPGFGGGTPVSYSASTDVSQNAVIDLTGTTPGFHTLFIRARNGSGRWSLLSSRPFVAASTGSNIVAVEYYFFDGAVATTPRTYTGFTAGQNVTIDYNAILVGLLPSTSYEIHIKGINAAGQRSAEVVRTFTTPSVICDIIPPNTTNTSRCDNGTVTLAASGVGAAPATYNWFDVATGGSLLASGSIYTPTVTATQTFFVNIIDGLGVCESIRVPVVASVVITPTPPATSGATTCAPASLTLTATGGTNGEYRWYTTLTGGNPLNGETAGTYLTPVISASTIFYVAINNGLCESLRVPVIAEFCNRSPVISPATTSTVIRGIATLDLLTLISDADNNVDLSSLSIVSTPLSGALASIDANQNLTVNYQGNSFTGSEVLTLEVCDLKLACAQEQITIEVAGEIAIYNAVSPNGDGKNDEFYIQYIDLLPDTKDNKVTIFNRWGEVVFEVTNYNNSTVVFRGLNQSGKELPTGTYFYKLTFPGGATTRTGFISLRR